MKISVISPNRNSLEEIGRVLRTGNSSRSVSLNEGGISKLRSVADQQQPDVLIVEGMCVNADELNGVDQIAAYHPRTNVLMLCSNRNSDFLLHAMRAGVREVLAAPMSAEALLAAIGRIERKMGLSAKADGKVLAFISCKGGSGATFLACNLAYALAARDKRVALLDLNLQFGDAALFLTEQKPATTLADVARDIHRLDASFLAASMLSAASNLSVLAAPEDPAHAMEVKPEHVDTLLKLARHHYDFVVLDVGRSLDAVSIKALDHADTIFPVMQLTLPFIRDGKRLLNAFASLDYPKEKTKLIVNRHQKGGDLTLDDLGKVIGQAAFQIVPNSYEAVAAAVNQGVPILKLARNNAVAKKLQEIADALTQEPAKGSASWIGRMFNRA